MQASPLQRKADEHLTEDRYDQAIAGYQACLESLNANADTYWHLGIALLLQGEEEAAQATWMMGLLEAGADLGDLLTHLEKEANRRFQLGQFKQAIVLYQQIVEQESTCSTAWLHLGIIHSQHQDFEQAVCCFQNIINNNLTDGFPSAYFNLGYTFLQQNRPEDAIEAYQQVLTFQSEDGEAYAGLGLAYDKSGQFEKAYDAYKYAVTLYPDRAEWWVNLGVICHTLTRYSEAITCHEKALSIDSRLASAHYNLAVSLQIVGEHERAIPAFQQAILLDPLCRIYYSAFSIFLRNIGQLDWAIDIWSQWLDLQPNDADAHFNRAFIWLQQGHFEQGWPEYEQRPQLYPTFEKPKWDGSDPEGRSILLFAEQGYGDSIQMIRYAPLVAARGGQVLVGCPAELIRLFQSVTGIREVFDWHTPFPAFDQWVPMMSLPALFQTTEATIPSQVPYLSPPNLPLGIPALHRNSHVKVGIVWASNTLSQADDLVTQMRWSKSCPLSLFIEHLSLPGVSLYSLQVGQKSEELTTLPDTICPYNLQPYIQDFADTAALICQLDLIISVDTATAHLAGALGWPTWVLLPYSADWRWLLDRNDSPWYPTMRLFRQSSPNDWLAVLREVRTALNQSLDCFSSKILLPKAQLPENCDRLQN